ncbi:hypothetical protein OHA21_18020 [Actinoplanes sp. NBC_00393]|uniref:hypothetical protein n=1 Tax=Actinoplanes sp. NBC_00393 TaxID=2975953 RepID=UPI002E2150A1
MTTPASTQTPSSAQPLAEALVALAETPDDMPGLDARLERLAALAAERIIAVDYAATAPRLDGESYTVATSGELVEDVSSAAPTTVAGAATTTMTWPGFRETAAGMGLGVVSVPLFTGSGATIANLDLYSRDADALAPLTVGICAAYDPEVPWPADPGDLQPLDAGGEELINGFAEALSVRATIQLALELMNQDAGSAALNAYAKLRLDAVTRGISLSAAATAVIARRLG